MTDSLPLLYTELTTWWPLLSHPSEYAEEAAIFTRAIKTALPSARTILELGSGGGNNASHMKRHFDMTLVDLSPGMLEESKKVNPGLPHHQGDMRTFRMDKQFDAVFVHDAVMYLTTDDDLRQAIQTAYAHTRPGGVALFVPDHVKETFRPNTELGGFDGEQVNPPYPGRALRYMEWTYDPDPSDTSYIVDFTYLLREGADTVRCVYDRHINGLFSRETWLALFREAGFQPTILPFDHSEVEPGETELILGQALP